MPMKALRKLNQRVTLPPIRLRQGLPMRHRPLLFRLLKRRPARQKLPTRRPAPLKAMQPPEPLPMPRRQRLNTMNPIHRHNRQCVRLAPLPLPDLRRLTPLLLGPLPLPLPLPLLEPLGLPLRQQTIRHRLNGLLRARRNARQQAPRDRGAVRKNLLRGSHNRPPWQHSHCHVG